MKINHLYIVLLLFFWIFLTKYAFCQTYLYHEPLIINDSLRLALHKNTFENIYPIKNRPCTISSNVLKKDSTYCFISENIFMPNTAPCEIQNLFTFDCVDSLQRTVFEGFINKGKYQGNYIIHYPSGYVHVWMILSKGNIEGTVKLYHDIKSEHYVGKTSAKGQLMVEIIYKNNLIWNVKKIFDENGNPLKKGTFKNGNGQLNIYRSNGKLLRTIEIKDGKLNGECKYLYSNGSLLMKGNYIDGLQHGIWKEYDFKENLIQQYKYKNGKLYID